MTELNNVERFERDAIERYRRTCHCVLRRVVLNAKNKKWSDLQLILYHSYCANLELLALHGMTMGISPVKYAFSMIKHIKSL